MANGVESLTNQQRRCLRAVAKGLTSPEMGYELGITENTVNVHIKAAIARLGAKNRRHAAQMVVLAEPDDLHPKMGSQNLAIDAPSAVPSSTASHRIEEPRSEYLPFPGPVEVQEARQGNDRAGTLQTIRTILWIAAFLILLLIALGPIAENAIKLANIIQPPQ